MECFESAVPAIFLSYAPTFFVSNNTLAFSVVIFIQHDKFKNLFEKLDFNAGGNSTMVKVKAMVNPTRVTKDTKKIQAIDL